MGQHRPLDEQLTDVHGRREKARDTLIRALIEIDWCSEQIETLLDRRVVEARPASDGRPAH
jgi:hypothetical protein